MIGYVKGEVISVDGDSILVLTGGIGFRVFYHDANFNLLHKEIALYTYTHVREDELSLYGFQSKAHQDFFLKLMSVKGLGPKTCLNIFKFKDIDYIKQAIENEDLNFIKSLPGVGKKTASQIILDLRGKLSNDESEADTQDFGDVIKALKNLGYKQSEINPVIKTIKMEANLSQNEYLKKALALLFKKRGN